MVRTAIKDTRRILGEVTPDSPLYMMIYEIFNIFSGRLGQEDDELDKYNLLGEQNKVKDNKHRMELLSLPTFVNYFKVAKDDDDYLDNFIDKISVLAEQEYYVDNGIDFDHLVRELHTHGFMLGIEITEKEPTSCL